MHAVTPPVWPLPATRGQFAPHRTIAALIALVMLSGCGTIKQTFLGGEDNSEPPAELVPLPADALTVEEVWSTDTGAGSDEQYLRLTPALDGTRIVVADADGSVNAYDAQTGDRLWSTGLDVHITGAPGSDGTVVAIGTDDGDVIGLSAESGKEVWRAKVSSEVLAPPQIAEGVVVVRTIDGKLFGLAGEDGTLRWIYDRTVPVLTLRGTSAPAVARGLIVSGFDGGQLAAIALEDGQTVWEVRLAVPRGRSEVERLVDIDAQPVIADSTVYAVTFQGRIAALDLLSGDLLWRRDLSSHIGLALDDDNVYVTDAKSHVWALDRSNSSSLWRQDKLNARAVSRPGVDGRHIVVGDLEGYVHWLDRDDGSTAARTRVGGAPILAPPLVSNDIVYVYSSDGTLAALRLRRGG
ncbi:MAG: outer membrane protein assembly factor BamB [Pseudomonadota bacterium]